MRRVTGHKIHKYKGNVLVNFRADRETLDAIDDLAKASAIMVPGMLSGSGGASKSRAIRAAILEAAARLRESKGGGK